MLSFPLFSTYNNHRLKRKDIKSFDIIFGNLSATLFVMKQQIHHIGILKYRFQDVFLFLAFTHVYFTIVKI